MNIVCQTGTPGDVNPLESAGRRFAGRTSPKLENLQQLREDFRGRRITVSSFPIQIFVESVYGCTGDCIMCEDQPKTISEFPEALLGRIDPFIKYLKLMAIHGSGEALLGRRLDRYVDLCRKNDCCLSINANPVFLNKRLCAKILSTRLSAVFSIHAARPETYRKLMGNDFRRMQEKLAAFSRMNGEIGDRRNNIQLAFVVVKDNVDEVEDFLLFASEVGIPRVKFMRLLPNDSITGQGRTRKKPYYRFAYEEQFNASVKKEFSRKMPAIREAARELGVQIVWGNLETCVVLPASGEKTRKGVCAAPWLGQLMISHYGNVRLCCRLKTVIGNLYEQDFISIWNSDGVKRLRRKFKEGVFPRACEDCPGLDMDKPEYDGAFGGMRQG